MKRSIYDTPAFPRLGTVLYLIQDEKILIESIVVKENKDSQCEFLNSILNGYSVGVFTALSLSGARYRIVGSNSNKLAFLYQVFYKDCGIHFDAEKCVFVSEENKNTIPANSFFQKENGKTIYDEFDRFYKENRHDIVKLKASMFMILCIASVVKLLSMGESNILNELVTFSLLPKLLLLNDIVLQCKINISEK